MTDRDASGGAAATLPLTVRMLQALGAWFCAILLIIAVAIGPLSFSGEASALLLAPLFGLSGYWLAGRQSGSFLADMGVPLCMAGAGLLPLAIDALQDGSYRWWQYLDLVYVLPAAAIWWFSRNPALRFAAALVLAAIVWYWLGLDVSWLDEGAWVSYFGAILRQTLLVLLLSWWWLAPPPWGERLPALRLALAVVALGLALAERHYLWMSANLPWQGAGHMAGVVQQQALPVLALVLAVCHGLRRERVPLRWALPWLAVLPLLLMSELFLYPVLLMWLAMLVPGRQRLLALLGGGGAVYAFSRFYYLLDWPLLYKGLVLIVVGFVLLGLAGLLRKESLQ
ncbi:DUF4401 domain-containing protein [Chitinilyticum litopenaei]|uniref:DUF4401 domain-containing protein n=1 Tax=Chitinilyticum litopenaei TaxID=1121276 RepID=UPI0003FC827B|nr:DUF4401 domain-containing protein [Chitinilyticum litopenaei]